MPPGFAGPIAALPFLEAGWRTDRLRLASGRELIRIFCGGLLWSFDMDALCFGSSTVYAIRIVRWVALHACDIPLMQNGLASAARNMMGSGSERPAFGAREHSCLRVEVMRLTNSLKGIFSSPRMVINFIENFSGNPFSQPCHGFHFFWVFISPKAFPCF